jgi:hypothetical protein
MSRRVSRAAVLSLAALVLTLLFVARLREPRANAEPVASAAPGQGVPGGLLRVRARNPLGAPLHESPEAAGVSARIPDGASARVLSVSGDGRWFEVEAAGKRGFLTRRYLELPDARSSTLPAYDSAWSSREACLRALAPPDAARDPKLARVGAWNLKWFPDGRPGATKPDAGTDLEWLACVIALLDVDVLAVEEIKHGARVEQALAALLRRIGELGGGSWRSVIDACPAGASQHVGFLYDETRAQLKKHETIAELNPHGEACKDQLRPGLAGYFAFSGGLDLTLVAVHLKSGTAPRDLALREQSFAAFGRAAEGIRKLTGDRDILVLGDMNTMGCETCSTPVTAQNELARAAAQLSASAFRRVPSNRDCSHFYSGKATLLDWAAAASLGELPPTRAAVVSGLCGELGCSNPKRDLPAQRRLSDHCPFVVELDDRDSD